MRAFALRLAPWLGLLLLCLLGGCAEQAGDAPPRPLPALGAAAPAPGYDDEVARLGRAIETAVRLLDAAPDDTQLLAETASLYLERAWLSGSYEDYRLAQLRLSGASARAGRDPAVCLVLARLHYTLHRLQAASDALAGCPATADRGAAGALRADIAFYRGDYRAAGDAYRALVNQVGSSSQYVRLAIFRKNTGSPGEAAALLEAAEKRYHGASAANRAWLKMQRGLLAWERGRPDEALALYRLAADELPGWWLVDEQIAEVKRLAGDAAGARSLYERIIARAGQPDHMDELARLLHEGGAPDDATQWIQRARAIYRERLQAFPEAGIGHAVEHFLLFGTPAQALELARRNAQLRPFGDAKIALASALFRAGQAGEAIAVIDEVQRSGWDTAQLHAVAAQVNAALGRRAEADMQRARAIAMNPHAMRMYPVAQPVLPDAVSTR